MNEAAPLSEAARALLAVHARVMSPPHDGAAVLAATRARLAVGEVAPTLARRPSWLVVVGAASAIAVASWLAWPSAPIEPRREGAAEDAAIPAVVMPHAAPRSAIAAPPERAVTPTVAIEPAAATRPAVAKPRVDRRAAVRADAQLDPTSTLADELALLGKARNALARNNLVDAGAALDAHASRHPNGKLREERTAMTVMLACASDSPGAAAQARDYLAREASRSYRARVRKSCESSAPQ